MILYLHGGGYIGTSPEMYAFFTARVCKETDCAVFVADYRLAPEFPYPAGAQDAAAVFAAMLGLGIPSERILLAGDSGGGGLANTLLLDPESRGPMTPGGPGALLARGRPAPRRALGDRERRPRHPAVEHPDHGVPPRRGRHEHVRVAVDGGPGGFPPTFVAWGGDEMFRDPIRRYVQRLRAAGCATEALEYEGRFHVFPILMPWLDDSRDVFRRMRTFIHKLLAAAPKWSDSDIRRELGLPSSSD